MSVTISPNAAPYTALITSEHNQKPNFMALVGVLTGAMGDAVAATNAIQPAFNLLTAYGIQLDIIGLWVGQPRIVPQVLVSGYFGFTALQTGEPEGLQEVYGDLRNVGLGGVWFGLQDSASGSTTLNDAQYRTVLQARILRNQSNGTLSAIEGALMDLFGVPCAVIDNGTMSLTLNIGAPITPTDEALLTSLDILPRPAGVAIGAINYTP